MIHQDQRQEADDLIALLSDRPVAYHPVLAKLVGGVRNGVYLSQMLYWRGRQRDPAGWLYKTEAEFDQETALTRKEQASARADLTNLGVLEAERIGIPARMRYRLDTAILERLIHQHLQLCETHNKMSGSAQQDVPNGATSPPQTHNYHTEIGSEITSEIPPPSIPPSGGLEGGAPTRDQPRSETATRVRKTQWPADFKLSDEMRQYAIQRRVDPEEEWEHWRTQMTAYGARRADWPAAWRDRVAKAQAQNCHPAAAAGGAATAAPPKLSADEHAALMNSLTGARPTAPARPTADAFKEED